MSIKLLLIETATEICSVGLSEGTQVRALKESDAPYSHTAQLTLLIEAALKELNWNLNDIDAVALSSGPGSYTALRVGSSVAKGICYALQKPLIAISTLEAIAYASKMQVEQANTLYCPMIDARRMEVYMALYDNDMNIVASTQALVIEKGVFEQYLTANKRIAFAGNGAGKCAELLTSPQHTFLDIQCTATHLAPLALAAYKAKRFEDIAYFSPNYLKAPNITIPKKRL